MPELPEVETVVRELQKELPGSKIWKVDIKNKSTFLVDSGLSVNKLTGKKIEKVWRRGKYIVVDLTEDLKLVIHLRMTGMLTVNEPKLDKKFIRVFFTFSNGKTLFFTDIRKFGKVYLTNKKNYQKFSGMYKLGVDPISDDFGIKDVEEVYKKRNGLIKAKLLDQKLISGIGNIYADEICFRVGLRPDFKIEKLREKQFAKLHEAIIFCLQQGIKNNGTTFSDFRGTRGDAGKNQKYLMVYGRTGDNCYRCKTGKIKKTRLAGRGTYYCIECQK